MVKITTILADCKINIEHLYQEPSTQKPSDATLVMITNTVKESELNLALADLAQLKEVDGEIMRIRIQTLG